MITWVWILAVGSAVMAVWAVTSAMRAGKRGTAARVPGPIRLEDTNSTRVPLREEVVVSKALPDIGLGGDDSGWWQLENKADAVGGESQQNPNEGTTPGARVVMTPDGPMLLTRAPFKLKRSVMTHRERQFARALAVKLPSGYVACPQVRLDGLVSPVNPRGWDARDWATWRRRVRMRAVDIVVCRLPEWTPVVALEITGADHDARTASRDGIVAEVCAEIGLPVVRCSRTPSEDWKLIEPYVRGEVRADAGPDVRSC